MHNHEQFEIIFYLEGDGRLETEAGTFPFVPGQAVVMPPAMCHRSISDGEFSSISVSGDFSHLIMAHKPVVLRDNEQGDGSFLAQMIYRNRHADSSFLSDLASAYVRFWLGQAGKVGATEAAVTRVYQQLSQHAYDKNIDVAGILDASGYAQDYIRMLFRTRYGAAPVKFLTQMRMERACFLLSSYKDSMSLSEVAEQVGYDDYVYFSKNFKAVTGVSPREYLKAKIHGKELDISEDEIGYGTGLF